MWLTRPLDPPIEALATLNPCQTAFMRHFSAPGDMRLDRGGAGAWTPLSAISPLLVAALVKAEDPAFFDHHGADWREIGHMLRVAVRARRIVGGASTITQQLARNLYLAPTRSLTRKLRELRLALRIDRAVSKRRTLELYLNVIEWGPDVWGCAAASARYFHKAPRDLDLFESTFLVSLIPAPKADISGVNASRIQRGQLLQAYRLFLSGLADAEECALCCHRVWQLHRLLDAGTPLPAALSASMDVKAGDDGALLRDVAAALDLRRLDPAELLPSHCGDEQQRYALDQLRARLGDDVLLQVLRTNSYAGLRDRVSRLVSLAASAPAASLHP
jgi:hypothetical protein